MTDLAVVSKKEKIKKFFKRLLGYLKRNWLKLMGLLIYPLVIYYINFYALSNQVTTMLYWFGYDHNTFFEGLGRMLEYNGFQYAYLLILAEVLLLYFLTGRMKKSMIIHAIVSFVFMTINTIVYSFRGTCFAILDIFSLRTALNVVGGGYQLHFKKYYWFSLIYLVFLIVFILVVYRKKELKIKFKYRTIFLATSIILIYFVSSADYISEIKFWNVTNVYKKYGQDICLLKQFDNINVKKPKKYSQAKAKEILERFEVDDSEKEETENQDNINVIVILEESFADLNGTYNLGYMENLPKYKSMYLNTIKGNMYSSFIGGGTANVEWECLTGNTMAFLPVGSVPYIQYIQNNKISMPRYLKSFGYTTNAFHAYHKTGYSRNTAYNFLGFDNKYFIGDMENIEKKIYDHPSDASTFENFLRLVDINEPNQFSFIATMQNHSPYFYYEDTFIDFSENEAENVYLNFIYKSDEAFAKFLHDIQHSSQKTIVLMFGDHQPEIINEYEVEDESLKYETVFCLWANFDIDEEQDVKITPNYFPLLLAKYGNIKEDSFLRFLKYVHENIPLIYNYTYVGKDGNTYEIDDKESPYYNIINEYHIVEYYRMFDQKIK